MDTLYETHQMVEEIVPDSDWNLEQVKDTYDDWNKVYAETIRNMAQRAGKLFIGLSSGYDSGSICCELLRQHIPFTAISIVSPKEDMGILEARWDLIEKAKCKVHKVPWRQDDGERIRELLQSGDITPYIFTIWSQSGHLQYVPMWQDSGANKIVRLCEIAQMNGLETCLTGQGSDEIMADYGHDGKKHFPHSNFGGKFQDNLANLPWWNFYGSTQRAYLMYIHLIGGHFGLNAFHPFLDKRMIQEFLSLKVELKNKHYKAPLHNYMSEQKFPFSEGVKIGF